MMRRQELTRKPAERISPGPESPPNVLDIDADAPHRSTGDRTDALIVEDVHIADPKTRYTATRKSIAAEEAMGTTELRANVAPRSRAGAAQAIGQSTDPVRIYLRKMGGTALLTREGEVELCKRIEAGEMRVAAASLMSPIVVREVIALGDKLRKHQVRVTDLMRADDTDNTEFDEEESDRGMLRGIERIKRAEHKKGKLLAEFQASKTKSRRAAITATLDAHNKKMASLIEALRLNKKTSDSLVAALTQVISRLDEIAKVSMREVHLVL